MTSADRHAVAADWNRAPRTEARELRRLGPLPRLTLASLALVLAAGQAALGLVEPDATPFDAAVRYPAWIIEQSYQPDAGDGSLAAMAIADFNHRVGGSWRTPIDRRTGRALLFQGTGLPLLPGAGNALMAADIGSGVLDADGRPTAAGVESLAWKFFEDNRPLFLPDRGELKINPDRSEILDDGRLIYADFDWSVDGVPVVGARAFIRINNGNLIQAGTRLIGAIDTPTIPRLKASEALTAALAHAGLSGDLETPAGEDRLELLPVTDRPDRYTGPVGSGVYYRLVWKVAFKHDGQAPTWTARVDALSGEVIEFYDSNQYSGLVTGGVYPRTVIDPEVVWPFPLTDITGGTTSLSDMGGNFPLLTSEVSSALEGRFFNTNCQGCSNPVQPLLVRTYGSGLVRFGTGGSDGFGNGISSRADRNSFYHLNIVRLVAKKWLSNSYLNNNLLSTVNINASCNAYYDGTVNFYRSSGTCNNTGEISDVMQHEWGHGLDSNTLPGDGATGEATADTVAIHVTHSPLIGPYFRKSGSPVRNVNKAVSGLMTTSNVLTRCGSGTGPLGREVHCEGEIYGQTTWDLATALVAKYGTNTGWRESEHTFFTAMPQSATYLPEQSGSIYDAYLAANDDDGNIGNGTPDGSEIYTAFNTHLIAGISVPSSAHCTRPAQPTLTATPGCDQISLSWTPVAGATSYRLQRHWQTGPSPFLAVTTTAGTSYVDTEVMPGITYHYVVQAVNATGCESSIETETISAPLSRARLEASNFTVSDLPAGNHSGAVDPGESVDVSVTLENAGAAAATGIVGSMTTTTPGVTISSPSASYPTLGAGASAQGSSAYRVAIAGSVQCGTPITLNVGSTVSGGGCPLETNTIRLDTGVGTVRVDDSFESNLGWAQDAANSNATTGGWLRGDPAWTTYQPGNDATPSGLNCWFTGVNSSGADDTGDVDAGQVTLLSPVFNLAGFTGVRVSYWRWFGQRDLGDDPTGDYFIVEVSNNGGSSWTALETLGDNVNAAAWTRKDFVLDGLLPMTSNMRFRVRVSDGIKAGDTGDIIEGAIDDFKITTFVCDPTPPCFTMPTFAGLSSVTPAGAACGQVGLSWPTGSSTCVNGAITYSIYRSTSPVFTPSPANRVATGVAGTGYTDSLYSAGTTYYYIVRANDSRSGEDGNAVTKSVIAPSGPDAVAPAFAGIVSAGGGSGCGETLLTWAPAQDCTNPVRYEIYRSTDMFFLPSPDTLIGETTDTVFTDAALVPTAGYAYIVQAKDDSGNQDANTNRLSVAAMVLPRTVFHRDFESGPGGFTVGPDFATQGNWELGNPVGTPAQPEDDTTPGPGVNCWVTGLAGGAIDANDVDGGTTTLTSPSIDLLGVVNPTVRYSRWFSNDLGPNPAQDTFFVEVSHDGGAHWDFLDTTTDPSIGWQVREVPITEFSPISSNMKFRFTAEDEPEADSVVEAAIDDFDVVEPTGGCSGCAAQSPVGKILLTKTANDVVISWTTDPVLATRYIVYRASGAQIDQFTRLGTTNSKTFTHVGAKQIQGTVYYLVSAVNACGGESQIKTP